MKARVVKTYTVPLHLYLDESLTTITSTMSPKSELSISGRRSILDLCRICILLYSNHSLTTRKRVFSITLRAARFEALLIRRQGMSR